MPEHWNGTLLLFSHGYQPTLRSPEMAPPGMEDELLDAGYALAASGYSAPGWAVAEAVPDQAATLEAFAEKFGKPKRTIAWGQSMGALVSVALAEEYPERIDGALPSCGSLAGSLGMMNEALDGAFAFKVLLAANTDVRVVKVDDDMANAGRVNKVLERALTTAQGRARLALASALAELPSWSGVKPTPPAPTDLEGQLDEAAGAFTRGVFLPRVDQERRAGGVFSWNTGIDYKEQLRLSRRLAWVSAMYAKAGLDLDQDLNALNSAPRIAADAHAVAYMRAHYVPNGQLRIPVLSYHTTGDGMTSVEQQGAYKQRVREAGRSADLATAWVQRSGHCTFTPEEHWAALKTLEARLTSTKWSVTAASLNAHGTAAFIDYEPAPFLRPCGPTPGHCQGEPAAGDAPRAAASTGWVYSDVIKTSQYVAVEDGTRLAIDIYRPARGAMAETAPLPVILLHSLGPRSEPRTLSAYGVSDLVRHGYVFVWMQPRGVGASFGKTGGFLTAQNGRDARDVIAWAAKQSWSTGKVGMMGLSNLGFIQWLTAALRPPPPAAVPPEPPRQPVD